MSNQSDSSDTTALRRTRAQQRGAQARHALLAVHKAIVDVERVGHERVHGRISAGEFLGLLVSADEYAWLRPLTALIVQLDELLDAHEATDDPDTNAWTGEIRGLLEADASRGAFQRRYAALLQASPDVALAHAAALRSLRG